MEIYIDKFKRITLWIMIIGILPMGNIEAQTREQLDILSSLVDVPKGIKSSSNLERNNKENEAAVSFQTNQLPESRVSQNCRVSGNVTYCFTEDQKEVAFECNKNGTVFNCVQVDSSGKLKRFGYDIFESSPSTFAPATFIPVSEGYLIGPGDTVDILLYGSMDEYYSLTVNRDGAIDVPLLGPIFVSGITFSDMREIITRIVENELVGVRSSISLGSLKSITVFVLGDANNPGSYTVSSLSTLTNVLFLSGGVNEIGSLRNIEVRRNGKIINNFDLYDLLLNGDNSKDTRLQTGDVIFIPPASKLVAIAGSVKRPAIYEIRNESNLEQILKLTGGLNSDASLEASTLKKVNPAINAYEIISLNKMPKNFVFNNGDRLDIGTIKNEVIGSIKLSGYIQNENYLEFNNGMKISDIFKNDSSLLPFTDTNYSLLVSRSLPSSKINLRSFSIENILNNPESEDNYSLSPNDEIVIFHNSSYNSSAQVTDDSQISTKNEAEVSGEIDESDQIVLLASQKEFIDNFESARPGILDQKNEKKSIDRFSLIEPIVEQLRNQADMSLPAKTIEVKGAVHFPGVYPLTQEMRLKDLIDASGGLLDSSYSKSVEITRTIVTGSKDEYDISRKEVNLSNKSSLDYPLQTRTTVYIRKFPDYQKTVKVSGEVKFPGDYTIGSNDTLSELIIRAGGYTDKAFSKGIIFTRESLKISQQKRLEELRSNLKKEIVFASESAGTEKIDLMSLQSLLEDATSIESLGRLVVDVDSIFNGSQADIVLSNQDELIIPTRPDSVNVIGEVYYPAFHLHSDRDSINDYITMSGGLTEFANENSIYVIKADGSVTPISGGGGFFRSSNSNEIQIGDTIVVPVQVDLYSGIRAATDISQVIYQLAITAAAVNSLSN